MVTNRMKKLRINTPQDVNAQISKNIVERNLTDDEIKSIGKIAKRNNIHIYQTGNNLTLQDILGQTSGATGENYKSFIKELGETLDLPFIKGRWNYGNSPYASLLEDQSPDAIKQIFPKGLDRPQTIKARESQASNTFKEGEIADYHKDLTELLNTLEKRIRRPINTAQKRSIKYSDYKIERMYKLDEIIAKKEDAIRTARDAKFADENFSHKNSLNKVTENYYKYRKRLKDIKDLINIAGAISSTSVLLYAGKKAGERKRSKEYQEEREKKARTK